MSVENSSKKSSILHSHEEEDHKIATKYANVYDVYLLGITIVIGGQVFSWNASLAAGYWEAFFGLMTTGFLYLSLILCIAEMTSALPFSGGSYGFVRVCLGPFFGYLVGCCETLQNIAYVASSVIPFAQMVSTVLKTNKTYEPIYWTFFFLTSIGINMIGGNIFWKFSRYIGIVSLFVILLYIAITGQYCDFNQWSLSTAGGNNSKHYDMNLTNFITYLPICAWYFIGVENLPLTCVDCKEPSKEIPYAMIACVITLFCTSIGVFFTTTSQYPGIDELSSAILPLNYGFQRAFGLTNDQVTWFALPATYATGFGFMFIYGRQMCSMARSGLFPAIFRLRTKETRSPYIALLVGSIFAVIGMVTVYYTDVTYLNEIFYLCILCSNSIYISVFLCYILFKFRYSNMERSYSNNKIIGVIASIYGIGYCLLSTISVLGYQISSNKQLPLIIFICYISLLLIYYYFFGYKTQKLSEEEQKVMFRAYVINANVMKRKIKSKGSGSGHAASTHGSARSESVHSDEGSSGGQGNTTVKGKFHPKQDAIREAERRRSSIASIPEDLLMYDDNGKVNEESVLRSGLSNHDEGKENQKIDEDDCPMKADAHIPCESTPTINTIEHYSLPVQTIRPLFSSSRVLPYDSTGGGSRREGENINNNNNNENNNNSNYSLKLFAHPSITKSFSEKVKGIIHDIQLVPFMNEEEREGYEELVLADVCGKLMNNTHNNLPSLPILSNNPEIIMMMNDEENQLLSSE